MTKWVLSLGLATATVGTIIIGCGENAAPIESPDGGAPSAAEFVVSGTVTGLLGSGLVLQNSGGDDLAVSADGTFAFAKKIAGGTAFDVTVKTHPSAPTQRCTVAGGTGVVISADVTSIVVDCAVTYAVGGSVAGLEGSGLVLQNNAGDDTTVSANGTFAFPTTLANGAAYAVTIKTHPTSKWQTCTVDAGSGTIAQADVTTVAVACTTNSYKVKASVVGLAGSGLALQNNAADDVAVTADGTVEFATPVKSGDPYAVTVTTQPTNNSQTCVVTGGTGSMAGGDITASIACTTNTYSVGGHVSGLGPSESVVLRNNGGDDLTVSANGTFTFGTPVASGSTYAVTQLTPPPGKTCAVANGTGTITNASVTTVDVTCATTLVGTVAGVSFFAVNVSGTMTDANILAACQAAGLTVPCQGPPGCTYQDAKCKQVGDADNSCGNPMYTLSQSLCGTSPSGCPALYGKYYYMGEHWNGGCGAEQNTWCTNGNAQSNKQALCVAP